MAIDGIHQEQSIAYFPIQWFCFEIIISELKDERKRKIAQFLLWTESGKITSLKSISFCLKLEFFHYCRMWSNFIAMERCHCMFSLGAN